MNESIKNRIAERITSRVLENLSIPQRLTRTIPPEDSTFTHMTVRDIHEVISTMANENHFTFSNAYAQEVIRQLDDFSVILRIFSQGREYTVEEAIDRLKNYIISKSRGGYNASTLGMDGSIMPYGDKGGMDDMVKFLNREFTSNFIRTYKRITS